MNENRIVRFRKQCRTMLDGLKLTKVQTMSALGQIILFFSQRQKLQNRTATNTLELNQSQAGPPGHVAQSVWHLTVSQRSWVRYPVWPHTFISPSADSRGAVVSYWRKYVHEVLVNRLGGLSLNHRKSVIRLTDRPEMTLDVYHGHKQQHNQSYVSLL